MAQALADNHLRWIKAQRDRLAALGVTLSRVIGLTGQVADRQAEATLDARRAPSEPWIRGMETWPETVEQAAEARLQADAAFTRSWSDVRARVTNIYAQPEAAMQAMRLSEAASPRAMEREAASSRIAGQLARDPSAFGALAGKTGLFASAAAKADREKALVNVPALQRNLARHIDLRGEMGDRHRAAIERERAQARIDIPALSPAAMQTLERIRDALDRNDAPAALGFAMADKQVRAELDRLNQALGQRFGERVFLGTREASGPAWEALAAKVTHGARATLLTGLPLLRAAQKLAAQEQSQRMVLELNLSRNRGITR